MGKIFAYKCRGEKGGNFFHVEIRSYEVVDFKKVSKAKLNIKFFVLNFWKKLQLVHILCYINLLLEPMFAICNLA